MKLYKNNWLFLWIILLILLMLMFYALRLPNINTKRIKELIHNQWNTEPEEPYLFKSFPMSRAMINETYEYFDVDIHKKYIKSPSITKIVHQSWKNKELPQFAKRYVKSWKECFPKWEYRLWTDEDNRNIIAKHYPWFSAKYDSFPAPIYKADCSRYVYMLHYGGIYTDLDNECLYPFEHLLSNYSLVFGTIDHVPKLTPLKENYVQNSFMYSQPNHPFWAELLISIIDAKVSSTADVITGPEVLSNMIHTYRTRYLQSHNIKIYEGRYFNPLTWGDQKWNQKFCKPFNSMSEEENEKCHKYYLKKGSYVVQYHTHVWG